MSVVVAVVVVVAVRVIMMLTVAVGMVRVVATVERYGRLVLQAGEHVVAERGDEEALDQLGGQPAATAVSEEDVVILRAREWTGAELPGSDRRAGIGRAG